MKRFTLLAAAGVALLCAAPLQAAFIVNASTSDAGFSFGGDTLSAGSSIASAAVGTSGASLFGGDGTNVHLGAFDPATADTYVFTYDLNSADNFSPAAGSLLGSTTGFRHGNRQRRCGRWIGYLQCLLHGPCLDERVGCRIVGNHQ